MDAAPGFCAHAASMFALMLRHGVASPVSRHGVASPVSRRCCITVTDKTGNLG